MIFIKILLRSYIHLIVLNVHDITKIIAIYGSPACTIQFNIFFTLDCSAMHEIVIIIS